MAEPKSTKFGSQTPFAEPAWYDDRNVSPYYTEHHKAWRGKMRHFVETEITPNVDAWEAANEIPLYVYKKASEVGLLQATIGWPDVAGAHNRPEGFDGFFSMIAFDELSNCGSGGIVWGLTGGHGIGLPPIAHYGSDEMHERVAKPCFRGEKRIALAVSEVNAGSDVANLATTAVEDGDDYIVNGLKKWITCGMYADFFTVAVRTGEPNSGMLGISLILIERDRPGVSTRPMDCMGMKGSGTAFVEFDDVRVPQSNYIGDVTCLLRDFVTERLGLSVQANRFARVCLRESIEYARRRVAFGKKLVDQPVVRYKIANMAREVEATHALLESLAYRIVAVERSGENWLNAILRIGAEAALCKVQATKTFAYCAKEAALLHGGNSYVKGNPIESLYRHVLALAIPGGSEDVMLDAAARLALKGRL